MDITSASLLLLLQAALGGALTIILALALIGGAVLLAAMLGGTLVGDESAKAEATDPILPPGTILGASGLGMAAIGAFYSFTFTFLGMMLGAIAYYREPEPGGWWSSCSRSSGSSSRSTRAPPKTQNSLRCGGTAGERAVPRAEN